jgi:hypothetical protein
MWGAAHIRGDAFSSSPISHFQPNHFRGKRAPLIFPRKKLPSVPKSLFSSRFEAQGTACRSYLAHSCVHWG